MQQQNAITIDSRFGQIGFDRIVPDTRKIIRRHIQDKDDVITDDDLRGIQILQESSNMNDSGALTD